jgi:hypothetical protein
MQFLGKTNDKYKKIFLDTLILRWKFLNKEARFSKYIKNMYRQSAAFYRLPGTLCS